MRFSRIRFRAIAVAAALLVPAIAIAAGNTVFFTGKGDLTFPFTPPSNNGGTAGTIDNMSIGQTTPRPGKFTTMQADTIVSSDGLTCATYAPSGTPAATDAVFFLATRPYNVVSINAVFSVTAGGASKLQVTKDTGTAAPGAGTDILTNNTNTGFDLAATANTPQVGTFAATSLAAGDRLAVDYANAIQNTAGMVVTACLAPQ